MEVLGDWISVLEILQKAVESHPTPADHRFKLFARYVKIGNFGADMRRVVGARLDQAERLPSDA